MLDLRGKVAVVTGAGSGIGRGIAVGLSRAGADIIASDRYVERAEETTTLLKDAGSRSVAVETDVRDRESVQSLAETAVSTFGRLDICVANAGVFRNESVLTMLLEDWNDLMAVNLTGVFLTVQTCAREMVRLGDGGRIVTLSSIAGERASAGGSAYCASKAGVRMMTRCWAQDLAGYGITVNSIGPGLIDTPMGDFIWGDRKEATAASIPEGRLGIPEEIGNLVCWLVSDEAKYITGTYNVVDGGFLDRPFNVQILEEQRTKFRELSGNELLASIDAAADQARAAGAGLRETLGLP